MIRTVLIVLMVLVGAFVVYLLWPASGPATVRVFAWPSAQVRVDGGAAMEAPSPRDISLSPGRHTFEFQPRSGGQATEVTVRVKGGRHHNLKVDMESGTYSVDTDK